MQIKPDIQIEQKNRYNFWLLTSWNGWGGELGFVQYVADNRVLSVKKNIIWDRGSFLYVYLRLTLVVSMDFVSFPLPLFYYLHHKKSM